MTDMWTPPAGQGWTPEQDTKKPEAVIAKDTGEWTPPAGQGWNPGAAPIKPEPTIITHSEAGSGLLPTWSASGLKTYEQCPHRLHKSKIEKIKVEQHPAAARGTAIHDLAERFVDGTWGSMDDEVARFIPEWDQKIFPKFSDSFEMLQEEYTNGKVELEGDWGFDKDWEIAAWMAPNVWARMKLDALHWQSDTSASVIDYKTGRKFGNEMAHATQGMIYAVGTFMRFPALEFIEVSFWYLDHAATTVQRYSRAQAMQFLPRITDRATIMTTDTQLEPKPSPNNCKWCDFAKNETCEWRFRG